MRSIDLNRRTFIAQSALIAGGVSLGLYSCKDNNPDLLQGVQDFLHHVANEDGSFRPGIDPDYKGTSDTGLSGIAAPAYATIISSTFGWSLPYPDKTREFFFSCQKPDGGFTHFPDETISDVDSLYFHVGGLVETGILKISKNLNKEEILGWGHAMDPEKTYSCISP